MNSMKTNVISSDAKTYLGSVVYLRVPSVMKFLLCAPTGKMNNMIREIFIYACILELKIIVSGHICYSTFPLS